ncbi:MAG: hypothetical protein KJ914_02095 [Gammaproteobacteria bacterium]|nr:hypothetical protein [Gammaproteobacteria bacterium]MBU1722729.1 hypothetical protein [Gammaproteobacteria bacterium]MBU2006096.1 hypothetical protein [Gammaproteobacteria bacterium]
MADDRSAVDTIKGYFYQFDLSILSLLKLSDDSDSIEIECIEDIDVKTAVESTAVQCKYYSKTEYNHSVIKESVMYMLSHFEKVKSENKNKIKYLIYGHYSSGQDKLCSNMDVGYLKEHFLTYSKNKIKHYHHIELSLNDDDLQEFLALLTINIQASRFEDQFKEIIDRLMMVFKCSRFSAENYYYNNALREIKNLSINSSDIDRVITKKLFLDRINKEKVLFNEWFLKLKGKHKHFSSIRKEYFTELNVSPFERFFLIEYNSNSCALSELRDVILLISKKWSKLSKFEPNSFCPYLFIHEIPEDDLVLVKQDLIDNRFCFTDGYPYFGSGFNVNAIKEKASHSNGIKLKILNSISDLKFTIESVDKVREIYQFYIENDFFDFDHPSVRHIKIQVGNISDIKKVI